MGGLPGRTFTCFAREPAVGDTVDAACDTLMSGHVRTPCARDRERQHGFARLNFAPNRLSVARWIIDATSGRFIRKPSEGFAFYAGQWTRSRMRG